MLTETYFFAFFLTLFFEALVAIILGYRDKTVLSALVFINGITHPLLWLLLLYGLSPDLSPSVYELVVLVLELCVVVAEYVFLRTLFEGRYESRKLFLLACAMNAVSYGGGKVMQLLGWL